MTIIDSNFIMLAFYIYNFVCEMLMFYLFYCLRRIKIVYKAIEIDREIAKDNFSEKRLTFLKVCKLHVPC